jgi:hypothetical protein
MRVITKTCREICSDSVGTNLNRNNELPLYGSEHDDIRAVLDIQLIRFLFHISQSLLLHFSSWQVIVCC